MQKDGTIKFWDDFYVAQEDAEGASCSKEWILEPSITLFQQLAEHLPKDRTSRPHKSLRILEIGCGTSSLGRELWLYIKEERLLNCDISQHTSCGSENNIHIWATDVSHVCIQQNRIRDAQCIEMSAGSFDYGVLNVAEPNPELCGQFDIILDKGCLDTFLFRRGGSGNKPYGPLVRNVLDNIQSWLVDGCGISGVNGNDDGTSAAGVYIVLSPRKKLKSTRDYKGFSNHRRNELDLAVLNCGDLQGKLESVFLHQCRKNKAYSRSCRDAFNVEKAVFADCDTCRSCETTFIEFRKGERMLGRGENFWFREWKGHCTHCTGL
jgi:hypothetical protein